MTSPRDEAPAPPEVRYAKGMLASTENVVRAGRLLRAMAARASWTSGVRVSARDTAKASGIVVTDDELAEIEEYMVGQGWVDAASDEATGGTYALTNHGLDEAQRKAPVEKPPRVKPNE